jgi:hypothetical protein
MGVGKRPREILGKLSRDRIFIPSERKHRCRKSSGVIMSN